MALLVHREALSRKTHRQKSPLFAFSSLVHICRCVCSCVLVSPVRAEYPAHSLCPVFETGFLKAPGDGQFGKPGWQVSFRDSAASVSLC